MKALVLLASLLSVFASFSFANEAPATKEECEKAGHKWESDKCVESK
jgi:hypothetical protein